MKPIAPGKEQLYLVSFGLILKEIGKNGIERLKQMQNQESWIFLSRKHLMKKLRESVRNYKCIVQHTASGNTLSIFQSLFKTFFTY